MLARRARDQAHQEHGAEVHLEVAHAGQHPHVRLLALVDVGVHRRFGHEHGLALAADHLGEADAELPARFAARQAARFGAAFPGGPQVGEDRELGRLAVHVERIVELHRRVLAAPIELRQEAGHVEVHRIHGAAHRAELGRVAANQVEVGVEALGRAVLVRFIGVASHERPTDFTSAVRVCQRDGQTVCHPGGGRGPVESFG